nr:hydroxyacylglutathione hydrolase family protein [uncultured Holophaga sp.]
MRLIFEQLRIGGDRNFAYLIGDREAGKGVLVDPAFDPGMAVERAAVQGLHITHILNTHGHDDHANGNREAHRLTGAEVAGGPGHPGPLDRVLGEGERIPVGIFTLRVSTVPGHTPDHLAFLLEEAAIGLTGDHLFVGKVGGTRTEAEGRQEWESLRKLLRDWPEHTTIWPGHDYGARPSSTLALERDFNPFLCVPDVEAFLALKAAWSGFKVQHGLK